MPPEMVAPPVPLTEMNNGQVPNGKTVPVDDGYDNRRALRKMDDPPVTVAPPVPLTQMSNGQVPSVDDSDDKAAPVELSVKELRAKFQ